MTFFAAFFHYYTFRELVISKKIFLQKLENLLVGDVTGEKIAFYDNFLFKMYTTQKRQ